MNSPLHIGLLLCHTFEPILEQVGGLNYPAIFRKQFLAIDHNIRFTDFKAYAGELPNNVDQCDVWLINGSPAGVYEDIEWIHQLSDFIKQLDKVKKPTFGICFGHQIIASALGGKVEKAAVGWGVGVKATSLTKAATDAGLKLDAGNRSLNLLYSHQDQVTLPAPGSTLLASTDICPVAMTAIGEHILSFQGHPEFSHDYAEALYRLREKNYPPAIYKNAMVSLEQQEHGALVAGWIIDFIAD